MGPADPRDMILEDMAGIVDAHRNDGASALLDRSDIKAGMQSILTAIDKIKSGISICIFPEGTRNRTEDTFLEFHNTNTK